MRTIKDGKSCIQFTLCNSWPFSSIVIVGSLPWAFIGKSATMWSSLDSIFIILLFTSANLPLHLIADHFSTVMKLNTGNKEMNSILHFQLQRNHSRHSYARKNNTIVPIREVLFHAAPLENQFKETTLPVEVHSIRAVLPTYWFLHIGGQSATFGENGNFRSFLSFRYTNTFRHSWFFSWQMYQTYLGYLHQIQLPKGTPVERTRTWK